MWMKGARAKPSLYECQMCSWSPSDIFDHRQETATKRESNIDMYRKQMINTNTLKNDKAIYFTKGSQKIIKISLWFLLVQRLMLGGLVEVYTGCWESLVVACECL